MAAELAEHFGTVAVPEYGRIYCEIFGNECDLEDLRAIRRGAAIMSRLKAAIRSSVDMIVSLPGAGAIAGGQHQGDRPAPGSYFKRPTHSWRVQSGDDPHEHHRT